MPLGYWEEVGHPIVQGTVTMVVVRVHKVPFCSTRINFYFYFWKRGNPPSFETIISETIFFAFVNASYSIFFHSFYFFFR
jgi:hypothetical protein